MPRLPIPPKPEEQIRPDALVRAIKKEKPAAGEKLKDIPVSPENYRRFKGAVRRRGRLPHGIAWGIAGIAALFVVGSIISFYIAKEQVKKSAASQAQTFAAGVAALQHLDTQSAEQTFALLGSSNAGSNWEGIFGLLASLFTGGRNAAASFGDLSKQLSVLSADIDALKKSVFDFTAQGFGVAPAPSATSTDLIARLTDIRNTLASIDDDSNQLSGILSLIGQSSMVGNGDFYLPLKARVGGAKTFLDSFIPWLASSSPHHILVIFQNPSEMRPGGGFLGSYADVTIASGSIQNVEVRDVADVDANFPLKLIPPKPLQLEVKNFRPADANWFFDFPTSASKTIQLFEASKLYDSTTFDGVIAVSPQVVSDLLSVTGPVTVASTTFTADNLLVQIQNLVQKGQAKQDQTQLSTYPKAVLGELSGAIFRQIASSTDDQRQQLLASALDWFTNRDVMAYFKDPAFENFAAAYGAAGDVYQLPQNFNGDYLALVDTNINGDKSDLYISQKVALVAQIGADGTITDMLTISRKHNGNTSPYWWYQTTNQDYLQVFVPGGSALVNETGGLVKKIAAPINYVKNGYTTDPLVGAIESSTQPFLLYPAVTSHEESGKEVFATWTMTPKGKTTTVQFEYTHRAYAAPADGVHYQFIFEKQAGSKRSYDFEIDAPLGYVFAENGIATYDYTSDNPPGRLVIDLTLEKL
jgi:hypothetical protein